jgi:hypothetical protein
MTLAVHHDGQPEEFTANYRALLAHYGMQAEATNPASGQLKARIVAETDITEQDSVFAKRTYQWGEMEITPGMLQGTGGLWWPERNNP